jgi:hypothetical protein
MSTLLRASRQTTKEAIQPHCCVRRWLKPKAVHETLFKALFNVELGLYQSQLTRNQASLTSQPFSGSIDLKLDLLPTSQWFWFSLQDTGIFK